MKSEPSELKIKWVFPPPTAEAIKSLKALERIWGQIVKEMNRNASMMRPRMGSWDNNTPWPKVSKTTKERRNELG